MFGCGYVSLSTPVCSTVADSTLQGDWKVTGLNKAGGLTVTRSKDSFDTNPEAILIGDPLDGTKNAKVKMGDELNVIEGVVTQAFGFYRILPKTALSIKKARSVEAPATNIKSAGSCKGLTVGQYNVENMNPNSTHIGAIATHISSFLNTPDLLFLQEVQDNDGILNVGVVEGSETLNALSSAIFAISGVQYNYTEISPVNNQDGGVPGGNIRVAYLYNPAVLSLSATPPPSVSLPWLSTVAHASLTRVARGQGGFENVGSPVPPVHEGSGPQPP